MTTTKKKNETKETKKTTSWGRTIFNPATKLSEDGKCFKIFLSRDEKIIMPVNYYRAMFNQKFSSNAKKQTSKENSSQKEIYGFIAKITASFDKKRNYVIHRCPNVTILISVERFAKLLDFDLEQFQNAA